MANGIKAYKALGSQRTIKQIFSDLHVCGGLGHRIPPKMPIHQVVGLYNARSFTYSQGAAEKCRLKRAL
jgi:hypothetical protein